MAPRRYWCELAWLGGEDPEGGVSIEVDDGHISAITTDGTAPPADAVRLEGLTVPALANTHSHAFHRVLRGATHSPRGTFWTWRDLMYRVAGRLAPDSYFELARATFAEMARAGIGVVGEFHYVHHRPDGTPHDDPNAMGSALAAAAAEVGIRLTLLDTAYLYGGFASAAEAGPAVGPYVPVGPDQRRFHDDTVQAWAERAEALCDALSEPTVRVGAGIHSVRAVDPESMEVVAAWADRHDACLHVHASEQPAENEQCVAHHGCSPLELLAKHGVLGPRTTVVHATHVSPADIDHLADAGAGCCLCPTTERDLADGIGPSAEFAAAGVPISLGSDSHAAIDVLEEARAVELHHRLATLERGVHPAAALMAMATTNGYDALGWPDGGRLAVGAVADFTTIGLDSIRLAGTDPTHALAAVVFAGTAADVHHVVVAGQPIVRDGHHVEIDVPAALAASIERIKSP